MRIKQFLNLNSCETLEKLRNINFILIIADSAHLIIAISVQHPAALYSITWYKQTARVAGLRTLLFNSNIQIAVSHTT